MEKQYRLIEGAILSTLVRFALAGGLTRMKLRKAALLLSPRSAWMRSSSEATAVSGVLMMQEVKIMASVSNTGFVRFIGLTPFLIFQHLPVKISPGQVADRFFIYYHIKSWCCQWIFRLFSYICRMRSVSRGVHAACETTFDLICTCKRKLCAAFLTLQNHKAAQRADTSALRQIFRFNHSFSAGVLAAGITMGRPAI